MRTLIVNLRNRTKLQLTNLQHYVRKPNLEQTAEKAVEMEVGKNPRGKQKSQVAAYALTFLHRLCMVVGRFIFKFIYGDKGRAMPPITDLILTESATSLAAKIRTQKVR